jgi:single-stranded-DNA-specific exonuclease
VVWGDFDADGQTATALLLETLSTVGADVTFHIPMRWQGHGLHIPALERLISGGVSLILTCDTGVTGHAAVTHASQLGAEVIVTDHHVPGEQLPPALAVVNPQRLPPQHALHTLSGVGVAYQLARMLDPTVADLALDLVALGTVADVSMLTGDTRWVVQRGLEALRHTHRLGLQAIYRSAELRPSGLTEDHVGYALGPRLNALGRLDDASKGVILLTTTDPTLAQVMATEVEGLNAKRRWETKRVTDAALIQIERHPALLNDHAAVVLDHPRWPAGIIGIVAGRLAERLGKPTVVISSASDSIVRASGRSVPGVNLVAALARCSSTLEGYGGHAGAAGCSLRPDRIPEFRACLSRAVASQMEDVPERQRTIDAYVKLPDLTLELVAEINRLAPFGRGNPPLTLAIRDLRVLGESTIGRTGEHRRVTVEDAHGRSQTVFWWHGASRALPRGRFDLAVALRASDYRGLVQVQLEWVEAREHEPTVAEMAPAPKIRVHDCRLVSDPEGSLRKLVSAGTVQVWAEGTGPVPAKAATRSSLVPCSQLAIWTLPPGPLELQAVLERVSPQEVILYSNDPGLDKPAEFVRQLEGMVRYALRVREGRVDLVRAAAATAQRVAAVRLGLDWLAARGRIGIVQREDEFWQLRPAEIPADQERLESLQTRLGVMLAETAAYRAYFQSAPAESLLR